MQSVSKLLWLVFRIWCQVKYIALLQHNMLPPTPAPPGIAQTRQQASEASDFHAQANSHELSPTNNPTSPCAV